MRDSRYTTALKILADIEKTFTPQMAPEQRQKAYSDAYPWGPRINHPYKMWLKAVKDHKAAMAKLRAFQSGKPITQWEGVEA